ncbi:lactam utilization protein [Marinobacter lipolyticus SM19]|uniref:Lactam utilization protein n=1 Tax=Marinobacter lipolyticus SM19 TaxID=1318628 RepID=R8B209_9GAMM|nr:5-oxoprolinase subunit PxpA [Marinobacter lipolyticus]EON92623.1 lactam utilization protein [Marinobacter lipolyticus SM19]
MKLNCDLGESYGPWRMGQDEHVMPLIDMANVACGFHAADPMVIRQTVALAARHKVEVGAHPSYHDIVGFGRRSIVHSPEEIQALMLYQLGALEGLCRAEGLLLSYVKPHGALNNDMMRDATILRAVMEAVRTYHTNLPLMIPVTTHYRRHQELAGRVGIPLLLEAFADRAYDDQGQLVSRKLEGAVHHDPQRIVDQALSFATKGGITSVNGQWLELPADSLCVHGDNDNALAAVRAIRDALQSAQ